MQNASAETPVLGADCFGRWGHVAAWLGHFADNLKRNSMCRPPEGRFWRNALGVRARGGQSQHCKIRRATRHFWGRHASGVGGSVRLGKANFAEGLGRSTIFGRIEAHFGGMPRALGPFCGLARPVLQNASGEMPFVGRNEAHCGACLRCLGPFWGPSRPSMQNPSAGTLEHRSQERVTLALPPRGLLSGDAPACNRLAAAASSRMAGLCRPRPASCGRLP